LVFFCVNLVKKENTRFYKDERFSTMISKQAKKQIDIWVAKYPTGCQSSAVMEALKIVQAENENRLNADTIQAVADYLDMPGIAALIHSC
jgi:NADH:ubiquinone oxidoreductase subunit E